MAKGEDALRRKKNKVIRKKMRSDDSSAKVSARVAAIIASKQRRKNGKRRMCEGMCFSLPTLEDPFNDKLDNKNSEKKDIKKKPAPRGTDAAGAVITSKDVKSKKDVWDSPKERPAIAKKQKNIIRPFETEDRTVINAGFSHRKKHGIHGNRDISSKFLIACLKTMEEQLGVRNINNKYPENHLLLNQWGGEFLACSLEGMDILETTGACASVEQIAWMACVATEVISSDEREGLPVPNPYLLILVPTEGRATQVRSTCKLLKHLGVHTVSLHAGASLAHQIQGLEHCEPEFLVSTPERLLELVSVKAIDISEISFLVIDGLEGFIKSGLLYQLKSIKQSIVRDSLTVLFCDSFGSHSTSAVQALLGRRITRLSHSDSKNPIASQSACISQSIHTCSLQETTSKGIQILIEECKERVSSDSLKVLFVEESSSKASILGVLLVAEGYSISNEAVYACSETTYSKGNVVVAIADLLDIEKEDMREFETVVITSFPTKIDDYVDILTGMARHSVHGELHSCFCREDAPLAGPLIEILENCNQSVPEFLRIYHDPLSMKRQLKLEH